VVKIAHLSDLHFGRTHEAALTALASALEAAEPDLTVVTGDLTQSGRRKEFAEAASFLSALDGPVLAVPGNHDAPVYNLILRFFSPWSRYEKHIGAASLQRVVLGDVCVIGVNSARRAQPRLNWSYGRLSRRVVDEVSHLAKAEQNAGRTVLLALHHPLVIGPNKAGAKIVGNGEYALRSFSESGVKAVLTGHVHLSAISPVTATGGRILSVQAGTAISTRQRGEEASFGLLDAERDSISLMRYRFTGDRFLSDPPAAYRLESGVWRPAL
jgi:3',5'-cyclic AMP phosphodiesterase CpdA